MMDARLMINMKLEIDGHIYMLSLPQVAPARLAYEALSQFQKQICEFQKLEEERVSKLKEAQKDK
jgi:hypothetical protein